ncbi:MAG: hypothetical protein IPN77_25550 [Sandaracinaceae bacterium]|nr:hypothetical protein [Sandaracinaceae bacterium]
MQRTLLSLLCSLSLLLGCSEARTEQQAEGSGSGGEQLATNVNDEDEEGTTRSGEEVASEPDTARSPGACPRSYGDQTPTCAADDFLRLHIPRGNVRLPSTHLLRWRRSAAHAADLGLRGSIGALPCGRHPVLGPRAVQQPTVRLAGRGL